MNATVDGYSCLDATILYLHVDDFEEKLHVTDT
jgi:hypothetical protein